MDNEHVMQSADVQQEEPKAKRFWKNRRGIALFVAFVLLFSAIGGYTLAYLQLKAKEDVKNDFRLADVSVSESTSGEVSFINNSEIPVYIRVAVIGNWAKEVVENGDTTMAIYAASRPVRGIDLNEEKETDYYLQYTKNKGTADEATYKDTVDAYNGYNADSWFKVEENGVTYYYHMAPVMPDNATEVLCSSYFISNANAPEGYSCSLEFAVQAIQAVGGVVEEGVFTPAVVNAWGDDITVTKVGNVDFLSPKGN